MVSFTTLFASFLLCSVQASPLGMRPSRGRKGMNILPITTGHLPDVMNITDGIFSDLLAAPSKATTRSLDSVEDPDTWGLEPKDEYVMHQLSSFVGDKKELDWVDPSRDAVSEHGTWGDKPLLRYITEIEGCTAIAIVSDKGFWFSHLMEPGFISNTQSNRDRWQKKIIGAFRGRARGSKFTVPATLAGSGGILNKKNQVKIYVYTPLADTATSQKPTLRYGAKVNELVSLLTGPGTAFHNVEVKTRGYRMPKTPADFQASRNSAWGKVVIEYDNKQLTDPLGKQLARPEKIYRVWLGSGYIERRWGA